ncbi:unnamed protein product [Linum trigynum]|uniref:RNase H type-1 domain-containing protein n=1 Tax=Linum trigynum TaxID=586398 RepID=A0AAV2CMM9_9ROSI
MAILQPRRSSPPAAYSPSSAGSLVRCHAMFDAATKSDSAGVAAFVLMDDSGDLRMAKAHQYVGIGDPYVLEALALRDCLNECLSRQLRNVIIGEDAKVIIDKCCNKDTSDARIGALLQEIMLLLVDLGDAKVVFVGRNRNRVAHFVARRALSLSPSYLKGFDFVSWFNSR